jgi:hypothetical protein
MQLSKFLLRKNLWGTHTEGETPVPIPNTAVKPLRADGSVVVRLCESRSVLLKIKKPLWFLDCSGFFILLRAFQESFI